MLADEPVWRLMPWAGPRRTLSAIDGRAIETVPVERALAVTRHYPGAGSVADLGRVERDQWSVHQRLDSLRPFHRVALGDAADTHLYVSAATGEIALDATRHERFWNWFGAVPHWIYFTPLRAQLDLWRDVVLWLSGFGIVAAVTGLVVGVMRVRLRRRYPRGMVTPYRGWMAWHHLGGLVAGTTLMTFVVSGWISMNPNRWFSPREPDRAALERYAGPAEAWPDLDRAALAAACPDAREARLARLDGQARVILACADGRVLPCCGSAPGPGRVAAAAARLLPEAEPPTIERLEAEDLYWYGHHHDRVLPVLRARFTDPSATWFHIDPATGEILDRTDRSNRIYRWLFNAPHSFDFGPLLRHRPAWDLLLIVLSLGGLLISASGVVIGWRRLGLKLR